MLTDLIEALEDSPGPVTVAELSSRLGIAPSALKPMLALLTAKGLLLPNGGDGGQACAGHCGSSCAPSGCPFVVSVPVTLSSVRQTRTPIQAQRAPRSSPMGD